MTAGWRRCRHGCREQPLRDAGSLRSIVCGHGPDPGAVGRGDAQEVENFPVSGKRVPLPVIRWLGRTRAAAARVNADLGLLDHDLAERIAAAGDAVAAGEHDDQYPIDVFQTGLRAPLLNMNANEVIANLARRPGGPERPRQHGAWSNDVFPSAVHLAALDERTRSCCRRWSTWSGAAGQGGGVRRRREDRPHPPDGRRAGHGWPGIRRHAAQVRLGRKRVEQTFRTSGRFRSAAPPPAPA